MNTNNFNKMLIEEIKNKTKDSLLNNLSKILPISKEAIYLRIREEVPFSYSEAAIISNILQISLDKINFENNESFIFKSMDSDVNISALEIVCGNILKADFKQYSSGKNIGNIHASFVTPYIPLSFIMEYKQLTKFHYYKSLHKNQYLKNKVRYADTSISEEFISAFSIMLNHVQKVDAKFILSDGMFENLLKEIKYFISSGLLEQSEVNLIRNELHSLIDDLEILLISGTNKYSAKITIYLSDLNLNTSFGLIKSDTQNVLIKKMFGMKYATSTSSSMIKISQESYEILKQYATLISQSGSTKRTTFLNRQHKIIDKYLST